MTAIPIRACMAFNMVAAIMSVYAVAGLATAPFWRRFRALIARHPAFHAIWLFCVLYWVSGLMFAQVHITGGSYIVFRVRDTPVNRCVVAFYRPWFICFMGVGFHTDPAEWANP
jgi:hypothetical protein